MKALELNENKELHLLDLPKPVPAADQVLVKIKAAALNHREIWISKGLYPGMTLPCILGADGAGVVKAVGAEVSEELVGQEVVIYPAYDWGDNNEVPLKRFRVLGMPDPGTIAEYIVVPKANIFPKPAYMSWEEAAAFPLAYLTAWRAMMLHGRMKSGDKVLITGIGGGVAQSGLTLALAAGAEVYVTSGSADKIADAVSKGAKGGVNYKDEDWHPQLKELSGGIDMVLDSSPSANFDDYFKFLNMAAKVVAYGSTASRKTTVNISKFFLRHIQFIGTAMGSPMDFEALIAFMNEHKIKPVIEKVYALDNALEAISDLSQGGQIGKMVISVDM